MPKDASRQKLLEFLDYLANKGLMAKATIDARKAAASKILGILADDEANDVTQLNLDEIMVRFQHLHGNNYTPGSLSAYLSRLKSAVDDFRVYLDNPLGFKPSVQSREKRTKLSSRNADVSVDNAALNASEKQRSIVPPSSAVLPIPIRIDTTIYVQGIPFDLTEAEANKIANVIRAMATPA